MNKYNPGVCALGTTGKHISFYNKLNVVDLQSSVSTKTVFLAFFGHMLWIIIIKLRKIITLC